MVSNARRLKVIPNSQILVKCQMTWSFTITDLAAKKKIGEDQNEQYFINALSILARKRVFSLTFYV